MIDGICANCEETLTGGFGRLWPDTNIRICYDCIDWLTAQRERQVAAHGGPVREWTPRRAGGLPSSFGITHLESSLGWHSSDHGPASVPRRRRHHDISRWRSPACSAESRSTSTTVTTWSPCAPALSRPVNGGPPDLTGRHWPNPAAGVGCNDRVPVGPAPAVTVVEGLDQRQYPSRTGYLPDAIKRGACYVLDDNSTIVGTITIDDKADPAFWRAEDQLNDALWSAHR